MKYLNFKKQLIWGAIIILGIVFVAGNSRAEENTTTTEETSSTSTTTVIEAETTQSTETNSTTTTTENFTPLILEAFGPTILDTIDFAGRTWKVRGGTGLPGITDTGIKNNWGNTDKDVFLDGSALHLRVSQHADDQKWYSSEVYLPASLGYGKYTFEINTRPDLLDHNLVAAPFLYQDDSHELDIEHSYWADETGSDNLFYVVQPGSKDGNKQISVATFSDGIFEDIIDWQPDKINFSTTQNGNTISSWTYTTSTDGSTNNFDPSNALVDINFWQYRGLIPTNNTTNEFIINNFTFDPYVAPTPEDTGSVASTASSTDLTVNLNIRYQNGFVFSGPVTLSTNTLITYNQGLTTSTTSTTVLTALINAAQNTTTFSISDLQLSDYGYYLNCLYIESIATSTCGNWNYVVNNVYPQVGMGSMTLNGGENIYIYFGDSWKITTPSNNVYINTSTPFYTWKYNYSDLSNEWVLDPNDLVAITIPNPTPTGWWDTDITVSTTLSNDQGVAYYNFSSTGTYSAKITDENYLKWSAPITLVVTDLPSNQNTTSTTSTSGGGSSSPSNQLISTTAIDSAVTKLINFIKTNQSADGKIIDAGTSDWLALTFAAKNIYAADVKNSSSSLYNYLYNYDSSLLDTELNSCAAYPRHILGLLASSVAKNDSKIIALKTKLDACVQNNIFGQTGINDDIFGLIAAIAIGEDQNSPVVQTTLSAIKANQEADGGFAYPGPFESPDLTGAAVNALKYAENNGATVNADIYTKAKQYLKNQQHTDGGWGCYDYTNGCAESDSLTTSWAVMGINALGEGQNEWFNSVGKNPWYILTTLNNDHFTQSWDGGIDWFGTKSAVPAMLGKSWPITLDPKSVTTGSGGSSEIIVIPTSTPTTTIATTTIATTTVATTTIATTTPATTTVVLATELPETKPVILVAQPTVKVVAVSPTTNNDSNNSSDNITSLKQQQQLSSAEKIEDKTSPIDDLPLDTPTRRTAKKVLAVTGGSAAALGLYLGLRLIKNVL